MCRMRGAFSTGRNFRLAVKKAVHRDFPHIFCPVLEQFQGSEARVVQLKKDPVSHGFKATRIFCNGQYKRSCTQ